MIENLKVYSDLYLGRTVVISELVPAFFSCTTWYLNFLFKINFFLS